MQILDKSISAQRSSCLQEKRLRVRQKVLEKKASDTVEREVNQGC